MEPAAAIQSLKRKRVDSPSLVKCIICQNSNKVDLRQSSPRGVNSLRNALNIRIAHNCCKYLDAIDWLQSPNLDLEKVVWHKNCFSSFTSKHHLERLKSRCVSVESESNNINVKSTTRSFLKVIEWAKCIFCQDETGDTLRQVMTLETSCKIVEQASNDSILSYRLGDISDLVAAEAKYHLKCYVSFCRNIRNKIVENSDHFDQACFSEVAKELQIELKAGYVFSLYSVWNRYCELLASHVTDSPPKHNSYLLKLFRIMLKVHFGDAIEFVANQNKNGSLLIIPQVSKQTLVKNLVNVSENRDVAETEQMLPRVFSELADDSSLYRSIYHLSSKVKADINETKGYTEYDVIDSNHASSLVPQSLFLLVSMLLGENDEPEHTERILSIAQDIIYVSSKGKKLTPKHIGLGISVHHATRSKSLVQLLHAAGHCVSYECVLRVDTSIANSEIARYKANGNVVIPRNLNHGKFVQFAGDNINIIEETLDGKGQFNATQVVAFQEKCDEIVRVCKDTTIGKDKSIVTSIPPNFHETMQSGYTSCKRPSPILPPVDLDWYKVADSNDSIIEANCKDLSWMQSRLVGCLEGVQVVPAWTGFNQITTNVHSNLVEVGYMPIIPEPADDPDTVYTVLSRCQHITQSLGQKHTVVTFDQALYCKAKEIVWLKPDEFTNTIVRLGGFHIIMNFMKVIGQHLAESGLKDVWVESGVFGENTAIHMLDGKAYNKAVRGHKLSVEALWRILWNQFVAWTDDHDKMINDEIMLCAKEIAIAFSDRSMDDLEKTYSRLVLLNRDIIALVKEFEIDCVNAPTFQYWVNYIEMVSILLNFIRAEREGIWDLHLSSFARMLPWFALYNHTNYSRWGPVYLADMHQLRLSAPAVQQQFVEGRFSIKRTSKRFSQVSVDQALEHVNKVSKVSGGIVGITRRNAARDKWCLVFNEKSKLVENTFKMFNLHVDDDVDEEWCHLESGPSRLRRDEEDVQKLLEQFRRFEVFKINEQHHKNIVCLSTKDVVPEDITKGILTALKVGMSLLETFVTTRLIEKSEDFYAKISRHKTAAISTMYKVGVPSSSGKQKDIKADRDLIQRLFVTAQSGRKVDLAGILKHELSTVPRALAGTDHKLHTTDKSVLQELLTKDIEISASLPSSEVTTCLLIDAPALIQAIGKPENAKTFGDISDVFCSSILNRFGRTYSRIDVLFDRYDETSIKAGTRVKRAGSTRPIRRVISSKTVKLPTNWKSFLSLSANKADLAAFLSGILVETAKRDLPPEFELVVSGGFEDILGVWSSLGRDIDGLKSTHEEADTRLILHAEDACREGYERVVLQCRDTDVLVLAIGLREWLPRQIWMYNGAKAKRPYVPVHEINLPDEVVKSIIAFHAMTGCDTVSQFAGRGKKTAWKAFIQKPETLGLLGSRFLTPEIRVAAEKFACMLYIDDCDSIDEARHRIFVQGKKSLDALPPTKDALDKHISRANYQALVWKEALSPLPELPSPTDSGGWVLEDETLKPILMTLPHIPKACSELVTCACKTGCGNRCGCVRSGQDKCISACGCKSLCANQPIDDVSD